MATSSTGETLHGLLYEPRTNTQVPYTQTVHNHAQGGTATPVEILQSATEAIPSDANATTVKVFDVDAFAEANKDYCVQTAGRINLNGSIPLVLTGVEIVWTSSYSDGTSSTTPVRAEYNTGGTAALRPRSQSQAGGSLMPAIVPTFDEPNAADVPVEQYSFYVGTQHTRVGLRAKVTRFAVTGFTTTVNAGTDVFTATGAGFANGYEVALTTTNTLPAPLTEDTRYYVINVSGSTFKLSLTSGGSAIDITDVGAGVHTIRRMVYDWPRFKAQAHEILLSGGDATLQLEADTSSSLTEPPTGPGYQVSQEKGTSQSGAVSVRVGHDRIPPSIHGAITFSGSAAENITLTASALASTTAIVGSNTTAAAITNAPTAATFTLSGFVTPFSLTATSPATVPTSGIYFYDASLNTTEYGQAYVTVILVDMSFFA